MCAAELFSLGVISSCRRNINGARYTKDYFGTLEKLTGVKWMYAIPDREHRIATEWTDGTALSGDIWYDVFDEEGSDVLAAYTKGHSAFIGKAAVVRKKVGKGEVILLGTFPSYEDMKHLVAQGCTDAGVDFGRSEGSVIVSPRGGEHKGLILIEYGDQPAAYELPHEMRDVLTGEVRSGRIELKPYEIVILEKI